MSFSALTIGQFARRAGLNPKTIRYYEEIGLLPPPPRNDVGYRLYSDQDLPRLRFVQRAKMLGLSLAEIKQLADYADDGCCDLLQEHLLTLVEKKLAEVDRRLAELAAFRDDLRRFHDELAAGIATASPEPTTPLDADSCQCIEPGVTSTER
jgi:DNA-binding transcriptional MerR regulator